jgi:Ca2+/H+ antiporter, TMEM165/GDT1 family
METNDEQEKGPFCRNKKHRAGWVILGIAGAVVLFILFGHLIMWLWNALMPVLFHFGIITFWQAVGLAVLARLIFGGMHHGHMHRHKKRCMPWKHADA